MTKIDIDNEADAIALVVDDNEKVLTARTKFLESFGFITIGVGSYHDALKEFRSMPRVDLVLTDINLPPDSTFGPIDTSGATLAQVLRAVSADLPIYGYSAVFAEGQLSAELSDAFTAYYPKGRLTLDEQIASAKAWKEAALRHRRARGRRAEEELKRIRESYHNVGRDFSTARELGLGSGGEEDQGSVEAVLARAGYRVKLIEPGNTRPRIDGAEALTVGPIVLWIKSEPDTVVAEVFGFPELYGQGPTEEKAIT
jgi:CheY-like chemotaxis protein